MTWGDVKKRQGGSGAAYLTIKDGEAKKIHIIDDEPHSFYSVFFNAIKKSANVDPDNNPCKGVKGFDTRIRHAINVYDYDDQKIKVLIGSNEMFNQFKAIHEEWGGFAEVDLKISREGTGFDTKYQVVPAAKCQWDDTLIEGQDLFDLPTLLAPTPLETVEKYMEGVDPGEDFDPAKLEGETVADEPADEIDGNADAVAALEGADEDIAAEEEVAPPSRKTVAKPAAKPAAKPVAKAAAPAAKPMSRNELIMKLNALVKTKARYKNPANWKADVQRFGGKDKSSMSQLGVEDLTALFKFASGVK